MCAQKDGRTYRRKDGLKNRTEKQTDLPSVHLSMTDGHTEGRTYGREDRRTKGRAVRKIEGHIGGRTV